MVDGIGDGPKGITCPRDDISNIIVFEKVASSGSRHLLVST